MNVTLCPFRVCIKELHPCYMNAAVYIVHIKELHPYYINITCFTAATSFSTPEITCFATATGFSTPLRLLAFPDATCFPQVLAFLDLNGILFLPAQGRQSTH